jgi:hypothetical protein
MFYDVTDEVVVIIQVLSKQASLDYPGEPP